MDKKEEFKTFIKGNPKLINYIKDNDGSMQKLYEIYDVYGEDDKVWEEYLKDRSSINLNNISNIVKNIDMNSIKGHINTAQKALNLVQELTGKVNEGAKIIKKPLAPKPLDKFFEDSPVTLAVLISVASNGTLSAQL